MWGGESSTGFGKACIGFLGGEGRAERGLSPFLLFSLLGRMPTHFTEHRIAGGFVGAVSDCWRDFQTSPCCAGDAISEFLRDSERSEEPCSQGCSRV